MLYILLLNLVYVLWTDCKYPVEIKKIMIYQRPSMVDIIIFVRDARPVNNNIIILLITLYDGWVYVTLY